MEQRELSQLSNIVESLVPIKHNFILITYMDKNNGKVELTYSSNLDDNDAYGVLIETLKKLKEEKNKYEN